MIVDFCKYRPPVQHHVTGAARPVAAAAYVGPRLIQEPQK
jgi:hypothetical protein